MSVPQDPVKSHRKPAPGAPGAVPAAPGAPAACEDFPDSQACPTCGKPFTTPFALRPSGLLDLVLLAREALAEVHEALEEAVLP